jgi:hypothetical protein
LNSLRPAIQKSQIDMFSNFIVSEPSRDISSRFSFNFRSRVAQAV